MSIFVEQQLAAALWRPQACQGGLQTPGGPLCSPARGDVFVLPYIPTQNIMISDNK
eukprot:TRINITY_DN4873_c0_g1_i1.p1 TRINITY_DN4873_c0_g1~~TRINITY_DN4873_c0_g1_i1.p1  ORF type:complete len:56 (+),score=5.85 TRINITY_DN4873_c0_g1_i1:236-403(+)